MVLDILEVARGEGTLLSLVYCGRTSPLRSVGAASAAAQLAREIAPGLGMQPPNEEVFTLFSEIGWNIVERVA
jgi:hypothetical protein